MMEKKAVRSEVRALRKPFYGWVIVFCSIVLTALGIGMFTSTNSVFVIPVCESLGVARAEFTFYRTIVTMIGALSTPFYGKLIRRIGVQKVLLAGAIMLSTVAAGYSFATELWQFYLIAVVNGVFLNGINFMSVGVLVNNWFHGKRGFAVGLAYAGSGFGGAVMIPIVSAIIEMADWRWAYRAMAALGIVILVPMILALVRSKPEEKGLAPLAPDEKEKKKMPPAAKSLSLREAMHTAKFWMLIMAFFLINFFGGATNTHSTPYLNDLGYPTAFVSAVISLFMIFLTVGKVILGSVYDRMGALAGNIVVCVFALLFPVFALLSYLPVMPWAYAVSVGMASCGVSVPISLLLLRYFGEEHFPELFSCSMMVSSLAPAFAVPAMGAVYDTLGSYRAGFIGLLVLSVIITVFLIGVECIHRCEQKQARTGGKKEAAS